MKRPFVSLNMASSLDGKITTFEKEKVRFGSDEDRESMENLRSKVDAILIGKDTLLADDPPLILRIPKFIEQRRELKNNAQPFNIVVSSTLDIPIEDSDFFREKSTPKIVFTTEAADQDKIDRLQPYTQVIIIPTNADGQVDLTSMVEKMADLGIDHLLLEGGGTLNFAMLNAGIIDEIYLTLCPFIIGGYSAPTTFDGKGFPKEFVRKLSLEEHRVGQLGEMFLKYSVQSDQPVVEQSPILRKGVRLT